MNDKEDQSDQFDWTKNGGDFRPSFRTDEVPAPWKRTRAGWERDQLVPCGKASNEYRAKMYRCPECNEGLLVPQPRQYTFACDQCGIEFGWGWGGLYQKTDRRQIPED